MKLVLRTMLAGTFMVVSAWAQAPSISAVDNGVSFTSDLSPGVLATIFGQNLNGANLKVGVNQVVCPILFKSSTQLNIQIPWQIPVGSANLVVATSAGRATHAIMLEKYSPALTEQDSAGDGTFYSGSQLITVNHPANGGDSLVTFGAGLGATNPAIATGEVTPQPPPLYVTKVNPSITVGPAHTMILFSGLTPGSVGIDQVNFTLAPTTPIGSQPVVMKIGTFQSKTVMIPIGCQDGTAKVTVTQGPIKHGSGSNYTQNVKITNATGTSLPAHGSLILTGLTSSATLANGGGTTCPSSDGAPYISFKFTGSGSAQTANLVLDFTDASTNAITYTARVLIP